MPICSECSAGSEVRANFCGMCGAKFPAGSVSDRIEAALRRQRAADQTWRLLPAAGGCVALGVWLFVNFLIGGLLLEDPVGGWILGGGLVLCAAFALWHFGFFARWWVETNLMPYRPPGHDRGR